MSKLINRKIWLTVQDAARHLSIVFNEEVSEADVLRFALDGHLQLSVNFVNHAEAKRGKVIPLSAVRKVPGLPVEGHEPYDVHLALQLNDHDYLVFEEKIVKLTDVWDLPLIGSERLDVEHKYQILTNGPAVTLQGLDGAFVEGPKGQLFQLQERFKEPRSGHYPSGGLPEDGVLVVRAQALRTFERSISEVQPTVDRPLRTRERRTLLTIIAALCKHSDINYEIRGAAQRIKNATELLGAPIDDGTIEKVIKEIPDALETRTK